MKNKAIFLIIITAVIWDFLPVSVAWPQGGWKWRNLKERGTGLGRLYDPQTMETITGKVTALDSVAARKGGAYGWRRVTLETNQQEISVILGPSWYLDQQQIAFTPGDILEVRGSRITYENVSCLMAAQVKKGKKTLKLRNKDGFPLWGGSRQRQ